MLYPDDTHDKEEVLIIFEELQEQNSPLLNLALVRRLFFPACVTCHGQLSMQTMTKQTNSYLSSLSFLYLMCYVMEMTSSGPLFVKYCW